MRDDDEADGPALTSVRTMDIVMALLMLVGSAIVIFDSKRIGFGWQSDGPAPGFFPFWVAIVLSGASIVNLSRAIADKAAADETFVSKPAFRRVLTVLLPTLLYVAVIGGIGPIPGLGIYVASALFIAGFMIVIGREPLLKSILVGAGVPIAMFFMFERWFLVPLPKGPLEALLGLG